MFGGVVVGRTRSPLFAELRRPTPEWFPRARLGIFVHWGPYSVPAWAEPIGEFGTFADERYWYTHNPYAEWYANTVRIDGSPAQTHHVSEYGPLRYESFLDAWHAEDFDAHDVVGFFRDCGARYVIPTAKHHDGVALWNAPGTNGYNTVKRGPRRDLIGAFRAAADAHGLDFGVYYSGGLDWTFTSLPPIVGPIDATVRPNDRRYAEYAFDHVADLIERYRPRILWGDIDWPDAGKQTGPKSLVELFAQYYEKVPDGVVNDRFGNTHWDFRTSEYEHALDAEDTPVWENTRGVGFSFGYNRQEDGSTSSTGRSVIQHFVDVIARGGNLLLNVGLTAAGTIPRPQYEALAELARWNAAHGDTVFDASPMSTPRACHVDVGWSRWMRTERSAHLFVDTDDDTVTLELDPTVFVTGGTICTNGQVEPRSDGALEVRLDRTRQSAPVEIVLPWR